MTDFDGSKTISGGLTLLRIALIVFPIIGLVFAIIFNVSLGTFETLSVNLVTFEIRRSIRDLIFPFISTFIHPLSALALGIWAAHRIKPFRALNPRVLKRVLIFFGVALPIYAMYNSLSSLMTWLEKFPDKDVMHISMAGRNIFSSLSFAMLCIFAASKVKTSET